MTFRERYGPWAFVAGASEGIGAAFAHEAAGRGLNVVMLARGEAQLRRAADEVRARHGVEVRTVAATLADPSIAKIVDDVTGDIGVGLFVYNATVAPQGRFIDVPLEDDLLSITVNCTTPVVLAKLLAPKMVERGRGAIGLVSSTGGTQGSINFALYNAGKAFQWVLAETLWAELGAAGVDVSCIFVGPTATRNYLAFQETLDRELCDKRDTDDPLDRARARLLYPSTPEEVAVALYDQLGAGPVCWSHPDDEWIARTVFAMPRDQAVGVWRGLQETTTRLSSRQAK